DIEDRNRMRRCLNVTDIDLAQLFGVFQNIGQLLLEKSRFVVGQIESRKFRDIRDVQVGAFGHRLKMQMVEQPNRRDQKRNNQDQKKNPSFAALFAKRAAAFPRSWVAVT